MVPQRSMLWTALQKIAAELFVTQGSHISKWKFEINKNQKKKFKLFFERIYTEISSPIFSPINQMWTFFPIR